MIQTEIVSCPYCGAAFDAVLDLSVGGQTYIEDCHVCCQPIEFRLRVDAAGDLESIELRRDDE